MLDRVAWSAQEGRHRMRVIVCGGRHFNNIAFVWRSLDKLHAVTPITELLHGAATGADLSAKEWAMTKPGIKRFKSKADWKKHGPAAGPIRNSHMLTWKPDMVVAFPGGKGTADMVSKARQAGIPVHEF